MDRNARAKVIWQAEKLELNTKVKGHRNGALGATGLAILRLLLFRYGNAPCPSYEDLKRHSGLAIDTIAECLKRLEMTMIVTITRRKIRTKLGNRVITNLYGFPGMPPVIPVRGEQRNPILNLLPYLHSLAIPVPTEPFLPWRELTGPLKDALESLGKAIQERDLTGGESVA